MVTSLLLGLVVGLVCGFVGGIFFYAKRIHVHITGERITREAVNSLVMGNTRGDFIQLNPVDEYMRNADGDIKLGDVLEDDRQ